MKVPRCAALAVFVLGNTLGASDRLPENEVAAKLSPGPTGAADGAPACFKSEFLNVTFSPTHPALLSLAVDSLGGGKVDHNVLAADATASAPYRVSRRNTPEGLRLGYVHGAGFADTEADWTFEATGAGLRFTSRWHSADASEPLVVTFDTHLGYSTLLGLFDQNGGIALPAVLHVPGFGTFRLAAGGDAKASLGYASGPGWVRVTFPPASRADPLVDYRWEVVTIYPTFAGSEEPALNGFRRNWLNIFQLNPNRRLLSNNTNSDSCGFCYYEYADIAADTPLLANNLHALDIVRQSLDRVLSGTNVYGMPEYGVAGAPGYNDFPEYSADTIPSLLIAAADCAEGRPDQSWLVARYPRLKALAEKMLATDRDHNGLIKYAASGDSGSWPEGAPKVRPANWWDTIGFGHEDAYANALAFRALQGMSRMAATVHNEADASRYGLAAEKLRDAYFPAFFNPDTGLIAGWRSADGEKHDYSFLFVNSIAVLYGLVPGTRTGEVMDRLWAQMQAAGFTNFRLGLPGNLVPVARKDYAHKHPRWGGGLREDNADGFQVYENGGATACFAYFTIAAFDRVGQHARARQILRPLLEAFEQREFEGTQPNGMTNDWRKWDGTAEGYEGFLVDNYYALLAVPPRAQLPAF